MNGLKNGLQEGLISGLNNGLADGLTNGLTNGLFVNEYLFDIDANKFLNAANINDIRIKKAINKLVLDLKTASIWTKMKAIYPMVGGTATAHKFNLKNPLDTNAAFRLSFVGGGTHSSNGYQPNGINAYANTFLSKTNLTEFSTHISYYSRSNITNIPAIEMGIFGSGSNTFNLLINFSGVFYLDMYDFNTNRLSVGSTDSRGFWLGNRSSSTSLKAFKNGTQFLSTSNVSNGWSNLNGNMFIGNRNDLPFNTYSNKECAFASIGDGLTDAEALALYNATQTFNTTLGRQV